MVRPLYKNLAFIFCFALLTVSGQQPSAAPDVGQALEKYFEPDRESVFLHLNKDLYVPGETLWFSGYIYNGKTGRPFRETSNLYVSLYNEEGELLAKKLFYCQEGYTRGQLPIDSLYKSGAYFIKASTNWMRNFKEDLSYVQQLRIVSDTLFPQTPREQQYDLQFLPEGGHLLADVRNTVGVKATNSLGYGVQIRKALVVDEGGKPVTNFKTNSLGLGKFEFYPQKGKTYKALIAFSNGAQATYALPEAELKGLAISLKSNPRRSEISFEVFTDNPAIRETDGRYTLLIHNKKIFSRHSLEFDPITRKASFLFKADELTPGMNIFTVFSPDARPVAERLFFNYHGLEFPEISIMPSGSSMDSLQLKISSNAPKPYKISVSVLPAETLAYGHDKNIYSEFHLRPYVKGLVEKAGYYFSNITERKQYDMDLLLLTQGWSRYNWSSIFKGPPQPLFPFDNGLQLLGTLNEPNLAEESKILLHKSENHGIQLLDISPEKSSFLITEFFPQNGENLYLSLLDGKGRTTNPGTYLRILNQMGNTVFPPPEPKAFLDESFMQVFENKAYTPPDFTENTIQLDEVTVAAESFRDKVRENIFIPPFLWNLVEEVDQDFAMRFPLVTDLIRMRGYNVQINIGSPSLVSVRSYRSGGLALIMDGVRWPNLDILYNLPMTQIESYYFDKLSRREGIFSNGKEVLYLYTRRGKELLLTSGTEGNNNAFEFLVKGGFEPEKTYYTPKYFNYTNSSYRAFGTVHWEAQVSLDEFGEGSFKMARVPLSEAMLFIEGMAPDGGLISGSQLVRIPAVILD